MTSRISCNVRSLAEVSGPLSRSREIGNDIPVEPDEAEQLALQQPFLIAVRAETLGAILDIHRRTDAVALHPLGAQVAMSVAPVSIVGSVGAL